MQRPLVLEIRNNNQRCPLSCEFKIRFVPIVALIKTLPILQTIDDWKDVSHQSVNMLRRIFTFIFSKDIPQELKLHFDSAYQKLQLLDEILINEHSNIETLGNLTHIFVTARYFPYFPEYEAMAHGYIKLVKGLKTLLNLSSSTSTYDSSSTTSQNTNRTKRAKKYRKTRKKQNTETLLVMSKGESDTEEENEDNSDTSGNTSDDRGVDEVLGITLSDADSMAKYCHTGTWTPESSMTDTPTHDDLSDMYEIELD